MAYARWFTSLEERHEGAVCVHVALPIIRTVAYWNDGLKSVADPCTPKMGTNFLYPSITLRHRLYHRLMPCMPRDQSSGCQISELSDVSITLTVYMDGDVHNTKTLHVDVYICGQWPVIMCSSTPLHHTTTKTRPDALHSRYILTLCESTESY